LILNYIQDGLGGVAALQFLGKPMIYKVIAGLFLELAQGGTND